MSKKVMFFPKFIFNLLKNNNVDGLCDAQMPQLS